MNAKQRRKKWREYKRLAGKVGIKYYSLKIQDELYAVFEHLAIWEPNIAFRTARSKTLNAGVAVNFVLEEISKEEFETYTDAFELCPVIRPTSLFSTFVITIPEEKARLKRPLGYGRYIRNG